MVAILLYEVFCCSVVKKGSKWIKTSQSLLYEVFCCSRATIVLLGFVRNVAIPSL